MLKAELNKNRKLGMEFEMFLPRLGNASGTDVQNTLAQILTSNGLPAMARGYSSTPLPAPYDFAVEYDSSIEGSWTWSNVPFCPIELKTKVLAGYDEWETKVPKALAICQDLGGKVNQSCGLHLHVSFTEGFHHPRNITSLYNLFCRWEPLVFSVLAPSRTGNQYCLPISEGKGFIQNCRMFDDYKRRLGGRNRKHGLNLLPLFTSNPHIEFRYHQGTLNESKARG
jgi:hypothetical protein